MSPEESEPHRLDRRPVVVAGSRTSAAEAALALLQAGTRVAPVHREPALGVSITYRLKPDIVRRIAARCAEAGAAGEESLRS